MLKVSKSNINTKNEIELLYLEATISLSFHDYKKAS